MRVTPWRVFYAIPAVSAVGRERPRERGDRKATLKEESCDERAKATAEDEGQEQTEEEGAGRHIDVRV